MPCNDGGPNPPQWELQEYKKKIDDLTEMLCSLCQTAEKANVPIAPKTVANWWKQHQKWDQERKASERAAEEIKKLKEKALAKLSKEERAALGLK